jgi:hypothetical protein
MKCATSLATRTALPLSILATALTCMAVPVGAAEARLKEALTFHASFDEGVEADFGRGDLALYSAPNMKRRDEAQAGLPPGGSVRLAAGEGRFGNALHFTRKSPLLFFKAEKNLPYSKENWSGTVSLWLRVDPETELAPGYTDPIQITPRAWNDACFFVEFGIEQPRPFRLGAYADLNVWNPDGRKFEDIPAPDRPLITVDRPPFSADRWTHVVFTFENFNTGRPDGVARLYLDGKLQGELSPREQTFTWNLAETVIAVGFDYVGRFDELAIFNRALSPAEIGSLHTLPRGIQSLRAK